jgi:hypothetical protein
MIKSLAGTPLLAEEGCDGKSSAIMRDTPPKTPQAMVASSSLLPGMIDIRITKRMPPGPKKSMIELEVSLSSMTNGMFTTAQKSLPTVPQ